MGYTVTSMNTKKTIAASLKKIMKTKPLAKITVNEIVSDCGLNRKTFYYHFEDIYALLKWIFEEEAIEIVKEFDLLTDHREAVLFIMDYIERNDYIINCAYDSIGRDEMKRFFYTDFIEITTSIIGRAEKEAGLVLEPAFREFLCKFYTEAFAGILIDWIKNRHSYDRQTTIDYLSYILKEATTSILQHGSRAGYALSPEGAQTSAH